MIFLTAYETTIGSGFELNKIKQAIKQSFVRDLTFMQNLNLIASVKYNPVFLTGRFISENEIPLFAHPMVVNDIKGNEYLVSDIRSLVSYDQNDQIKIKNTTEYNFTINRVIANLSWIIDGVDNIKNNLLFANLVFAIWITESVSRKFALDPKDQIMLSIITYCYYSILFTDDKCLTEDSILNLSNKTANALKVPIKLVLETFDAIKENEEFYDITSYCEVVKNVLKNIRLKDFNAGLLITAVGNSWFGFNYKEILAVALEHPPTWSAIIKSALEERTYKNSLIARIAERYGKNNQAKNYLLSFDVLVKEFSVAKEELDFKPFDED